MSVNLEKLIQLRNGNWIDPKRVTHVQVLDQGESILGNHYSPRVVIKGPVDCQVICCATLKEAEDYRDELAREVNSKQ